MWAETTTSLILIDYLPAVSLFQDFWEMASRISHRRFRPRLSQLLKGGRYGQQQAK
jgi:hypothetical protein